MATVKRRLNLSSFNNNNKDTHYGVVSWWQRSTSERTGVLCRVGANWLIKMKLTKYSQLSRKDKKFQTILNRDLEKPRMIVLPPKKNRRGAIISCATWQHCSLVPRVQGRASIAVDTAVKRLSMRETLSGDCRLHRTIRKGSEEGCILLWLRSEIFSLLQWSSSPITGSKKRNLWHEL